MSGLARACGRGLALALIVTVIAWSSRAAAADLDGAGMAATDAVSRELSASALAGIDSVVFELGPDPSAAVIADALSLAHEVEPLAAPGLGKRKVVIRHLGRGRVMQGEANAAGDGDVGTYDPADERREDPSTESAMVAFNARSGNEFLLITSTGYLEALSAQAVRLGQNLESDPPVPGPRSGGPRATGGGADPKTSDAASDPIRSLVETFGHEPGLRPASWSNSSDDRFRKYGVNAAVAGSADRRRVQLGTGCTGTLVGPRHVVTAGHCLWSRRNQAWSDDFVVAAGRNGSSSVVSVTVNNDNIPGGQVLWYFTPSAFRDPDSSNTGPVDFGVLVVPSRLGDTTGWYGWWVLAAGVLQSNSILRAGYPLCVATDNNGVARIDEPSPCSANHLYSNLIACSLGEFANLKAGWSRTFNHSCDASGGDSGSALFLNYNGQGNGVTGVHTTSLCEKTASDVACTGNLDSRPLRAVRITPEYSGWITYFRNEFP